LLNYSEIEKNMKKKPQHVLCCGLESGLLYSSETVHPVRFFTRSHRVKHGFSASLVQKPPKSKRGFASHGATPFMELYMLRSAAP
jgi:hypothetical protein